MHRLVWDSVCKSPWTISEMGQRRICTAATRYQNNKIRFQLRSLIFIQTRTTQEHSTRRIPSVLLITKGWITNHQVLKCGTGPTTSFRPLISPSFPNRRLFSEGTKIHDESIHPLGVLGCMNTCSAGADTKILTMTDNYSLLPRADGKN